MTRDLSQQISSAFESLGWNHSVQVQGNTHRVTLQVSEMSGDDLLKLFGVLALWDYSDAAGAKREHARGLAMLEQRKAEADEARRRNLEEARKRRRAEREVRDAEIVYLVSEGNSYETVAGIFGLSPKTIKNLVGQSKECLANPHGYAINADIRPVVDEPSSVPALALRGPKSAPGKAAREKRRRTFEQRTERRQSEVERLAEEGVVPAEIADRGDELRAAGNVRYRVTAVIPQELVAEFIDSPLAGILEVERL